MNKRYADPQTDNASSCPHCGGNKIVSDHRTGERVCGTCGVVVTETIMDTGPEYRVFNIQEANDRRRTGTGYSMSIYDKGLSTVIKGDKDASGKRLDYETQRRMRRLQRQDNRSKINETQSRNLSIAMAELDRMVSELHLPKSVKENGSVLEKKPFSNTPITNLFEGFVHQGLLILEIFGGLEFGIIAFDSGVVSVF